MPFIIEKNKSKGGKSVLKHRRNIITGKEKLISKEVEYATKDSPRKVFKNVEVRGKEGVTSNIKIKEKGKTMKKEKSFSPNIKRTMN